MRLVLAGDVIGIAAAAALARFIQSLLYGVPTVDGTTYVAVSAVLALTALPACYLPALRATRVDPLTALRHE